MKTQGSDKKGEEKGKSLNTKINIKNKTGEEEHKTTNGTTDEQAGMNKDESGKQTSEKGNIIIVNTNQSSVSKLNTEENYQNKRINGEAKSVTSFECKSHSFDDVFLDNAKSEKKCETEDKKLKKDNRSMHQTSQEMSSNLQDSTRSYSEVNNELTVTDTSLTMKNEGKHEQSTTRKENNRNPNTTKSKVSSKKAEGIINSSYDERKTSGTVTKRKKSSMVKTMSGGGRKVKLPTG
jgi:hypothetical protein